MKNTPLSVPQAYQLDIALAAGGWTAEDIHFLCQKGIAERLLKHLRTPTEEILRNLRRLGVQEMTVDALVPVEGGRSGRRDIEVRDISLAKLCGEPNDVVASHLQFSEKLAWNIQVIKDGKKIGYLSSDLNFHYEEAPSTTIALGWQVATDIGRRKKVRGFNRIAAAAKLNHIISQKGTSREVFANQWMPALKAMMTYGEVTRFADGYCYVANTLWTVATREVTGKACEGCEILC